MKKKAILPIALALLLAALTVTLDCCSTPDTAPAPTETGPVGTDVFVPDEPESIPVSEVDEAIVEAVADHFALEEGDFSKLEKYWYGTVSKKITAEGAEMESEIYGWRLYHNAAPIVMTEERWNEMWAEADEKYADDSMSEFVRVKIEGFYSPRDFSKAFDEKQRDDMKRESADLFSIDITTSGPIYVLDLCASPFRIKELGGYFDKYFGYTLEDVRDAAREAGMTDADEIGTVEPYFVFEYADNGGTAIPVEYSEEAAEKLEALCREYVNETGRPTVYGKYEYEITGVQTVSEGEKFDSLRNDHKEQTGKDLLEICRVDLDVRSVGETLASTGEYREYGPDELIETDDFLIFLRTEDGWEPAMLTLPGGSPAGLADGLLFLTAFTD
ncbi:MAG: hypothetical protein IJM71_07695 [Clostridia bacterium]|nr:hypothetical protein [Clostridia bacterium]